MPLVKIPKLVNGRGTLQIDFTYARGRIRAASGTTDPRVYRSIRLLLEELENVGNLEALDRIRAGAAKLMDVYAFYQRNGKQIPYAAVQVSPLKQSVRHWLETMSGRKESTRRGYSTHLTAFLDSCADADVTTDIPKRLRAFREARRAEGALVGFNHTRTVLKTFARDTVTKEDELYKAIFAVPAIAIPQGKRKVSNRAVSIAEVIQLTSHLRADYAQMVWAMCYSGMRSGEYFEIHDTTWTLEGHTLNVRNADPGHGNKGGDRTGVVPFAIQRPTPAGSSLSTRLRRLRAFTSALRTASKASAVRFTPHTGRKCAANWMAEAGIPQHRIIAYIGHASKTITQHYQNKSDVSDRAKDVQALREYITVSGWSDFVRMQTLQDVISNSPNPALRQRAQDALAMGGPSDLPRNPFHEAVLDETMDDDGALKST